MCSMPPLCPHEADIAMRIRLCVCMILCRRLMGAISLSSASKLAAEVRFWRDGVNRSPAAFVKIPGVAG